MEDKNISKFTLESILLHFSKIIKWLIIVIIIEAVVIAGIVAGIIWSMTLPVEEYTASQVMEDITDSKLSQTIGDK